MNVWYWPYRLAPLRSLSAVADASPRSGALIRTGSGFADVHPWPELGDAPLEAQLDGLARGVLTPLTRRSLALAAIDGEARERRMSAFDGLAIPPSHWTLTSAAPSSSVPQWFDTVKIKMIGGVIDPAFSRYKLRLDFNGALSAAEFIAFADSLSSDLRAAVEFVEDPCPYDQATWTELRQRTGLSLALDRGVALKGVDVLVVKPALQDFPDASRPIVVTTYMDHPLGQLGAAYVAARHSDRVLTCGLMTHVLYERNEFSDRLAIDGNRLVPPAGTGFGFDDLLEKLPWRKLQ